MTPKVRKAGDTITGALAALNFSEAIELLTCTLAAVVEAAPPDEPLPLDVMTAHLAELVARRGAAMQAGSKGPMH